MVAAFYLVDCVFFAGVCLVLLLGLLGGCWMAVSGLRSDAYFVCVLVRLVVICVGWLIVLVIITSLPCLVVFCVIVVCG